MSFPEMTSNSGNAALDNIDIIPSAAQSILKHYVYLLRDPVEPFKVRYIGRGQGSRATSHAIDGSHNEDVNHWIRSIRENGKEPRLEIILYGLPDAALSQLVESALIFTLSDTLNGRQESMPVGRKGGTINDVMRSNGLACAEGFPPHSAVVVINETWDGEDRKMLYPCTRGWWPMKEAKAITIRHVFACYKTVIVAAFDVEVNADGTTNGWRMDADIPERLQRHGGWVFVGKPTQNPLAESQIGRVYNQFYGGIVRYPS
jgi:hypothetical protein